MSRSALCCGASSGAARSRPSLASRWASRLEDASARAASAEQAVFTELANSILAVRHVLTRIAHAAGALDLVAGLARAATEGAWSRPELADDTGLEIQAGRHPVTERLLNAQRRSFTENDCQMCSDGRLWLLIDPNRGHDTKVLCAFGSREQPQELTRPAAGAFRAAA
jgi:DNA mismatch repair protein MutS